MNLFLDIWYDSLDGGTSRRRATTYTGQMTQKNTDTNPWLEWDSNP